MKLCHQIMILGFILLQVGLLAFIGHAYLRRDFLGALETGAWIFSAEGFFVFWLGGLCL